MMRKMTGNDREDDRGMTKGMTEESAKTIADDYRQSITIVMVTISDNLWEMTKWLVKRLIR